MKVVYPSILVFATIFAATKLNYTYCQENKKTFYNKDSTGIIEVNGKDTTEIFFPDWEEVKADEGIAPNAKLKDNKPVIKAIKK